MIIDFHAHVHIHQGPEEAEALVAEAQRCGVDRVGISAIGSYVPSRDEVRRLNDQTFAAAECWTGVVLPFVKINPMHGPDALAMIDEGHARGAVGIKLWVAVKANQRCVWPVAERAIELELPVLQHAWHKYNGNLPYESDPLDVAELGRVFPELSLVMAHLGGSWDWGIRAVEDVPNVLSDVSGSVIDRGQIEYAVERLGAERVIYGSDAPYCDYLATIAKIETADISDETKHLIFSGNAARVLGMRD